MQLNNKKMKALMLTGIMGSLLAVTGGCATSKDIYIPGQDPVVYEPIPYSGYWYGSSFGPSVGYFWGPGFRPMPPMRPGPGFHPGFRPMPAPGFRPGPGPRPIGPHPGGRPMHPGFGPRVR